VGRIVELVVDPLRGERISVELPIAFRVPPEQSRHELGLAEWVDLADPLVAQAVALLGAARRGEPQLHLAFLGGAAHRMTSLWSNRTDLGLRRSLHDLDLACLHKELPKVRTFLTSVREREGSGLQFFETQGDRIFNSMSEGRRLRLHMVISQEENAVRLGTIDLLADEFRFCHHFDLRPDLLAPGGTHGTLTPTLLLVAKLQYIQRIPAADQSRVPDRVLAPFGRREVVIGPEPKDVKDVLALLLDHPVAETPDGISPARLSALAGADWGLWRTLSLNLEMVERSPLLQNLPDGPRLHARGRLSGLRSTLAQLSPKRRLGFLGGPWWEEVDAVPAVDSTVKAE